MSDRRRHSEKEPGGYDESQNYGNSRQSRYEGENKNSTRYQAVAGAGAGAAPSRSTSPPPHHATKKNFSERRRSNSANSKDGYGRNESQRNSGRGRGQSRSGGGGNTQSKYISERNRDYDYRKPQNSHYGGDNYKKSGNNGEMDYETGFVEKNRKNNDDRKSEESYASDLDRRRNKRSYQVNQSQDSNEENISDEERGFRAGDRVPEKLDPEQRENFPFRVFIKDEYLKEGLASKNEIEEIIRQTQIDDIQMDNSIQVPDMPGQAMIIKSSDLQKREDALREVLTQIERIEKDFNGNKNYSSSKVEIALMTFVPEGLVAVTIGHKGRLIQRIKEETGVSVVINQRVRDMSFRSTYATGSPKQLSKACSIMYDTLEQQAYLIKDWDKAKNEQISKEDIKLTAKFIVDTDACGFIIGKHGNFTKYLENNLGIYMRCDKDDNNRILRSYQSICAMKGTLKDIQRGIKELCKRLEEYYKTSNNDFQRFPFNVVIPANYVTKIIGAGGCMVKNIAQHANGAQIKINSDKDSKKNLREVSVAINGSIEGKYRAAHLIIEQVEIFKYGGPIIQSGKVLNQNLAAQIQNSGLFKEQGGQYNQGLERRDEKEDRSNNRRKKHYSRSRSQDRRRDRSASLDSYTKAKKSHRQRSNSNQENKRIRKSRSRSAHKKRENDDEYHRQERRDRRSRSPQRRRYQSSPKNEYSPRENRENRDRERDQRNDQHRDKSNENKNYYANNTTTQARTNNNSQRVETTTPKIQTNERREENFESKVKSKFEDYENSIEKQKFEEPINPENVDITDLANEDFTSPANLTEELGQSSSFKHLSRFSDETNEHIITLGIQLSKNHPILSDHKFQADLQEKIKFNSIEVNDKEAVLKIESSVEKLVKIIKQLASKIITTENTQMKDNEQNNK